LTVSPSASTSASPEEFSVEPKLEEQTTAESSSAPSPSETPNEPGEDAAAELNTKPLPKVNAVAHEVRVKATGARPGNAAGERELFSESTSAVLVFEKGGVIRLAAAVTPGQLLFLSNEESKREVVAQVMRKRAYRPTECYVELEFTEPAPKFWGMEFSAATALLPKDAKEMEAAALVASAEITGDEPGDATPPPSPEEVQALRKEVEALRSQLQLTQMPGAAEQDAPATTVPEPSAPAPAVTAGPQTEVLMAPHEPAPTVGYTAASLPIEPQVHPAEIAPPAKQPLPAPVFDFSNSLPKRKKRSFRARGNFTPGFRSGAFRLALLTAALVVTMIGAAWYKHWLPWSREAKKIPVASWAGTVTPTAAAAPPRTTAQGTAATIAGNEKPAGDVLNSTNATPPGLASANATVRETAPANSGETSSAAEVSGKPKVRGKSTLSPSNAKRSTVQTSAVPAIDSAPSQAAESVTAPPKLIRSERAVASLDDLRDFETGSVMIDAVVDQSGDVIAMNVLSGPPSLRMPAKEALKHFKYEPALRNGKPVPARVTVKIQFHFEP
jgi:periplasmic protein TonB